MKSGGRTGKEETIRLVVGRDPTSEPTRPPGIARRAPCVNMLPCETTTPPGCQGCDNVRMSTHKVGFHPDRLRLDLA
jgi:hypothetical protein